MTIVLRSEDLVGDEQEPYRTYDISTDNVHSAIERAKECMIDEYVLEEDPELACVILEDGTVLLESDT